MGEFLSLKLGMTQVNLLKAADGYIQITLEKLAFDLPSSEIRDEVKKNAYDKYLLILGCGEKSIRFRPYLTTEKEEIDKGLNILREVLKEL